MTAPGSPNPEDPQNQPPQSPYTPPPGPYPPTSPYQPPSYGNYPPPAYQQFPGYAPPPVRNYDGKAIASIVLSGLSVPLLLCYGAGGLFALAGIIFGVLSLRSLKTSGQQGHGLALSGVWIGVGVLVISVVFWVLALIALSVNSYSY